MTLICIEEHALHGPTDAAAGATLLHHAPYMSGQSSSTPVARANGRRPAVDMATARRLGADLGTGRIHEMDRHGIDVAVLSWTSPARLAPDDVATALARSANDQLAAAVAAHPDRLAGFATLPWQHPDDAVAELDRAVTELGLRGVLIRPHGGTTPARSLRKVRRTSRYGRRVDRGADLRVRLVPRTMAAAADTANGLSVSSWRRGPGSGSVR